MKRLRAFCVVLLGVAMALPIHLAAAAWAASASPSASASLLTSAGAPAAGLAATPPMGFNDWNAFGCDVSATLIEQMADVIVSSGLKSDGYGYVNIDDCWPAPNRDANGNLVADPARFPDGIAAVAAYVHSKGLKLGIYEDAGTKTCAGYPGSLGHEQQDAATLASWGVDYLKYDNCYNQSDGSQADYISRYTAMSDAIKAAGRPMVYSLSEWGTDEPWLWAPQFSNLWRTTGDISDNWPSLKSIITQNAPLYPYARPGHWNDPDMLEIGNGGMTDTEYRTQMSMWSMMAAPLIIGTDLRNASAATMSILGNKQIIAVDQDRLGVQGKVISNSGGLMVLDKPLASGDHAIALYNSTDTLATVSVPASVTTLHRAGAYRLLDLWSGRVTQAQTTISAAVPAHGTVVYRVRPLRDPDGTAPSVTVAGSAGTLVPGASGAGTLSTTVTNRGAGTIRGLQSGVTAPAGWTVTPSAPAAARDLRTDTSLTTTWTVVVPDGASPGSYPLTLTASYTWDHRRQDATSSELVVLVVTAPPDGNWYLSALNQASTSNGLGPVEADQSNGAGAQGDGQIITIAGTYYDHGLGTGTPSQVRYYLGGRCSQITTRVGIDDEAAASSPATFTIYADNTAAAASGPVNSGDAPQTLTANLTGATWLTLATAASDGSSADHTDWAAPVLTCGTANPGGPVQPTARTLFSYENGTDGFTIANPGDGGTVTQSPAFHTDGGNGLAVQAPVNGNWFGEPLTAPIDLSGTSSIAVDMKAGPAGTTAEIAVQTGSATSPSWCQGGLWTWLNPGTTKIIQRTWSQIKCPTGVTLDLSQIHGIWVFLNTGGGNYIDNIRVK